MSPARLRLREILRQNSAQIPSTTPAAPSTSTAVPTTTRVTVEVTASPRLTTNGGSVEVAASLAGGDGGSDGRSVFYDCPLYVLQASSSLLHDVLEDLVEGDAAVPPGFITGGSQEGGEERGRGRGGGEERASDTRHSNREAAHGVHHHPVTATNPCTTEGSDKPPQHQKQCATHAMAGPSVTSTGTTAQVVPLPFLSSELFETVALFMEHFYGVSAHRAKEEDDEEVHGGNSASPSPAVLRHPLAFRDLYALSDWEQQFALERLLPLPARYAFHDTGASETPSTANSSRVAGTAEHEQRWGVLTKNGAWVDALGTSGDTAAPAAGLVSFTLTERQVMVDQLCTTLEAATRLGMPPLQQLCAALIANTVVDADEKEVLALLQRPTAGSGPIAPFGSAQKAALVEQFPALSEVVATAGASSHS